jgi:hypothetical protein
MPVTAVVAALFVPGLMVLVLLLARLEQDLGPRLRDQADGSDSRDSVTVDEEPAEPAAVEVAATGSVD